MRLNTNYVYMQQVSYCLKVLIGYGCGMVLLTNQIGYACGMVLFTNQTHMMVFTCD